MGEFIDKLIREGDVAGFWDAHSGNFVDLGLNGNDGTIQAAASWEGFGIRRADGGLGIAQVTNHASIQLATFTVVGVFDRLDLTAGHQYIFYKNNQFYFSVNADGRLYLQDFVNLRSSPIAATTSNKYFAISLTNGGIGQAYIDGLNVGAMNNTSTITSSVNVLHIGGANSTLRSGLLISRVLTAAEHAQLYDELANLRWPTKFYSSAKRTQAVDKADPGLVAGWNMRPAGGVIPDEIGANDGTIAGPLINEQGILGNSMRCGVTGSDEHYIAADGNEVANGQFTYALWLKSPVSGVAQAALSEAYTLSNTPFLMLQSSLVLTRMTARLRDDAGNAINIDELAAGAFSDGMWKRYVIVRNATHLLLYRNGVLQGSALTAVLGATTLDLRALFNLRRAVVSTQSFMGQLLDVECFDEAKDIDWIEADYLEGARAIQFKTDWGFQQSPAPEGGVLHQQIGGGASPIRAGDAAGCWKIETDTVNGRLCKVLTCTTAGKVYIPTELFFDASPTECAFGTWDLWFYKVDAATMKIPFVGLTTVEGAGDYRLQLDADESVLLVESGVGILYDSAVPAFSADTWTRLRVTRSSAGVFNIYLNDTFLGTGTSINQTISNYMVFGTDVAGCKIALGNIQGDDAIVKRLGVVAP